MLQSRGTTREPRRSRRGKSVEFDGGLFRVECTSGEPATSGVTGRIFHNKNNDQPYFDSSKAPQKRPKVFPLPDKKKQPHLMFVMPGYCGDSAAAASAAAFRH
jgi:hypothetical protein